MTDKQHEHSSDDVEVPIYEGLMVEVAPRMWPGINKPGGYAMVKKLHSSSTRVDVNGDRVGITHVDVWYPVERKRESRVPMEFVKVASHLQDVSTDRNEVTSDEGNDGNSNRRRRVLMKRNTLGRCTRCKSLRRDCGSCDWLEEQRLRDLALLSVHGHECNSNRDDGKVSASRPRRKGLKKQRKGRSKVIPNKKNNKDDGEVQKEALVGDRSEEISIVEKGFGSDVSFCSADSNDLVDSTSSSSSSENDEEGMIRVANRRRHMQKGTSYTYRNGSANNVVTSDESDDDDIFNFIPFGKESTIGKAPISLRRKSINHQLSFIRSNDSERSTSVLEELGNENINGNNKGHQRTVVSKTSGEHRHFGENKRVLGDSHYISKGEQVPSESIESELQAEHDYRPSAFIQPEDDPDSLPTDIVDRSKSIPYVDLPDFFSNIVEILQMERIPDFYLKLARIKAKLRNQDQSGIKEIEALCVELEKETITRLIHEGLDQLRNILRRCERRSEYAANKKHLQEKNLKRKWKNILEMLDIKFTEVDQSIDSCFVSFDETFEHVQSLISIHDGLEESDIENIRTKSSSESESNSHASCRKEMDENADELTYVNGTTLSEFNPHQYASRISTVSFKKKSLKIPSRRQKRRRLDCFQSFSTLRKASAKTKTGTLARTNSLDREDDERVGKGHLPHTAVSRLDLELDPTSQGLEEDVSVLDTRQCKGEVYGILVDDVDVDHSRFHDLSDKGGPISAQCRRSKDYKLEDFLYGDVEVNEGNFLPENKLADEMQKFLDKNHFDEDEDSCSVSGNEFSLRHEEISNVTLSRRRRSSKSNIRQAAYAGSEATGREGSNVHGESVNDISSIFNLSTKDIPNAIAKLIEVEIDDKDDEYSPSSDEISSRSMVRTLILELSESFPVLSERCSSILMRLEKECLVWANTFPESIICLLMNETSLLLSKTLNDTSILKLIYENDANIVVYLQTLWFALGIKGLRWKFDLKKLPGISAFSKIIFLERGLIDAAICQIVDVLYSQICREAWASNVNISHAVLVELFRIMVRLANICHMDNLGRNAPVIETLSRILLENFSCQKWYSRGSHIYVSSIDPHTSKEFCLKGIWPKSEDVRLEQFGSSIPRMEINCVWKLITIFASCRKLACTHERFESHSRFTLKILDKLFYAKTGSLVDGLPDDKSLSNPCPSQLLAANDEIISLRSLVFLGLFDPRSDKFVSRVITSATLMDCNLPDPISINDTDRNDLSILKKVWKSGNISIEREFYDILSKFEDNPNGKIGSQVPVSSVLNNCCSLIYNWILKLGNGIARWVRMSDTFSKLVDNLIYSSERKTLIDEEIVNKDDTFGNAFAFDENRDSSTLTMKYKYSAAFIFLTIGLTKNQNKRLSAVSDTFEVNRTFLNKIWSLLSNDELERTRRSVTEGCLRIEKIKSDWQSLCALLESSKALTSLTLLFLKSETNLSDLMFAFSCIIACLFHGIAILKEVNYYESGTFVGFRSKKRNGFPNGVETARILTRINVLLCQIISRFLEYIRNRDEECQRIRSNHAFSKVLCSLFYASDVMLRACLGCIELGEAGDAVVLSTLMTIRHSISLTKFQDTKNTLNSNDGVSMDTVQGNDDNCNAEYELEDDIMMSIDVDQLIAQRDEMSKVQSFTDSQRIIAIESLWESLVSVLMKARPSTRFAVRDFIGATGDNLSSSGISLVSQHSEKIVFVLALLVPLVKDKIGRRVDVMFNPQRMTTSFQDIQYMKLLGECFCVEVCELSQGINFHLYEDVLFRNQVALLENFFEVLCDSSVLHFYPSCNYSLIQESGGCMSKNRDKISKALNFIYRSGAQMHPDIFGEVLTKENKKKDDQEGFLLLCRRLWTFASNVGKILQKCTGSGDSTEILSLSDILIRLSSIQWNREFSLMPYASIEVECLRRLRMIVSVIELLNDSNHHQNSIIVRCIATCIKATVEHLQYVSEAFNYYHRTSNQRKSKFRVMQNLYSCMSAVITVVLLRKDSIHRCNSHDLRKQINFLKSSLMNPSLSFTLKLKKSLLKEGFNVDDFSNSSIESSSRDINEDMWSSFIGHMREIFFYLHHLDTTNESSEIVAFLTASISSKRTADKIGKCLSFTFDKDFKLSHWQNYVEIIVRNGERKFEKERLIRIREFLFDSFIMKTLYSDELKVETHINLMSLLLGFISTSSYLEQKFVFRCLKAIFYSLRRSLSDCPVNDSLLTLSFKAANKIFQVRSNVSSRESLLEKSLKQCRNESSAIDLKTKYFGSFVKNFAQLIYEVGIILLRKGDAIDFVEYLTSTSSPGGEKNIQPKFKSVMMRFNELITQEQNPILGDLFSPQSTLSVGKSRALRLNRYKKPLPEPTQLISTVRNSRSWSMTDPQALVSLKRIEAQLIETNMIES